MASSSLREIIHLVASLLVLTIAFTYPNLDPEMMAIVAFGVGTGFILHELAHKFTAQRYGYVADYEASPMGLLLAIGLKIFTGIVFAAPGAVMIRSRRYFYGQDEDQIPESTEMEFAYISVSGAVVNLILAIIFLSVSLFTTNQLISKVLSWSAFINVFLAGFNMIPFGPLDGSKVWRYNPVLWGVVGIPAIILFLFVNFLLPP